MRGYRETKGEAGEDERKKTVYGLCVKVESSKKKRDSKRLEGLRKSVLSLPEVFVEKHDRGENKETLKKSFIVLRKLIYCL